MLIALRNIVIIALLALLVTVAPAGGSVVSGILAALALIFLAAVGLLLARVWNDTALTRDTMTEGQRWAVYGALGALALMVAGFDELLSTGAGTIVLIAVVAGSGWILFSTWRALNSY